MKSLRLALYGFVLLLLTACSSVENSPLELKLELRDHEVHSIEEVRGLVYLTNQSDSSLLVHSRLFLLPLQASPYASEGLLLIYDSSGNRVVNRHLRIDYRYPSEETLHLLKPGKKFATSFYLSSWFYPSELKQGEKYTIAVIYQNDIDITKTIGGIDVPSWVGTVRSNKETFVILP
jgi:hypothetical protein